MKSKAISLSKHWNTGSWHNRKWGSTKNWDMLFGSRFMNGSLVNFLLI